MKIGKKKPPAPSSGKKLDASKAGTINPEEAASRAAHPAGKGLKKVQ